MSPNEPIVYVSVVGTNYLYPICSLLEGLEAFNKKGAKEVPTSPFENGYSVSIVVLAALLLESALNNTQHVRGEKNPKKPVDFVRSTSPTSIFAGKIEEVFVVRDVIVHNHLWERKLIFDEHMGIQSVSTNLKKGYGDTKFNRVLNLKERRTRQLGINLFPTRICRTDAVIVLKNVLEFLLFLEKENQNYISISSHPVKFNGRVMLFTELVAGL